MQNQTINHNIIVLILATLFTATSYTSKALAAEKTMLKLNLKPGQTYKKLITTKENISQTIANQTMDIAHTKKMGLKFEVKNVKANGIASIKVTYQTLYEKTVSKDGLLEFDSSDPNTYKDNPLTNSYLAMIGEGFLIEVAGDGTIVELTQLDKMFSTMAEKIVLAEDKMISELPPQCDMDIAKANSGEQSQDQLTEKRIEGLNKNYGSRKNRVKAIKKMLEENPILNEEQIRLMLSSMIMSFPDTLLQPGDSWTDKINLKAMMLPVKIDCQHALQEVNNNKIVLTAGFARTMKEPAMNYNASGIQAKITIDGSYQQSSEINKTTGWLIRNNAALTLTGEINMPANPNIPQGLKMPITLESTITVE